MARRLIPLLDRVLIEKVTAPTKSAGGVLLPESATPKVCYCCLVAKLFVVLYAVYALSTRHG